MCVVSSPLFFPKRNTNNNNNNNCPLAPALTRKDQRLMTAGAEGSNTESQTPLSGARWLFLVLSTWPVPFFFFFFEPYYSCAPPPPFPSSLIVSAAGAQFPQEGSAVRTLDNDPPIQSHRIHRAVRISMRHILPSPPGKSEFPVHTQSGRATGRSALPPSPEGTRIKCSRHCQSRIQHALRPLVLTGNKDKGLKLCEWTPACNSLSGEAEAGRSLTLHRPGLHSQTLSQKRKGA